MSRTAMLLGREAVERLEQATVAVFGLGGVGSYTAEALARAGVGRLILVDGDTVSDSNRNRQLIALCSTVGQPKAEVMARRVRDINPACRAEAHTVFYLPGEGQGLIDGCDFVADAVDTVAAKLALAVYAKEHAIPIISSMGTGNKLHAELFEIADIRETSVCPLCRVMRKELKARGIEHLKVLYSKEIPLKPADDENDLRSTGRPTPGSVSFVPPVAGLLIAGEVIRDLLER